jgi:hypothetical protein
MVIPVSHPAKKSVSLARKGVATQSAMDADGRGGLEIPDSGVVCFLGFVGECSGGADFNQIAAEFTLKHAVRMSSKIHMVMGAKHIEIPATSGVSVKPDAAVTLDAPVHFMVDERPQILVAVGPFFESVFPVSVPCHHRHVLEMAFAAFIAHRAVMGVVDHQPLYHGSPELHGFGVVYGNTHPFAHRGHAGHDDFTTGIVFVPEPFYGAQPAGSHRPQGGMPAEMGHIKTQGKAGMKQVQVFSCFVGFAFDMDGDPIYICFGYFHGHRFS